MGLKKSDIKRLAQKALEATGNPYIQKAYVSYVGDEIRYHYARQIMTEDEIDQAYLETAEHDIQAGFNDRMVGYYDKWYRYNHADEGYAYDLGVKEATKMPKCVDEMTIIPA